MVFHDETNLRTRIASVLESRDWDIVWFSRVRSYRLCADLLPGEHILDLDDLNDRLFESLISDRRQRLGPLRSLPRNILNRLSAMRWSNSYRELIDSGVHLVVCHDGQREHLGAPQAAVVPNGYPRQLACRPQPATDNTMLFVGPLTYEPNYLAVRWFVDEVLDLIRAAIPDAQLSVVGEVDPSTAGLDHEAVRLHGFVPDVEPYYADANVAIAPLHSGGGTRVKILEAMARSCPMVATPFAYDGLDITPGEDLSSATSAVEFAEACIALLSNPDRATELADHALHTFTDRHQADHSSNAVAELVTEVFATARTGDGTDLEHG